MFHYTYDNWEQHMNKINKYTTLAAEKYKNQGKKVSFTKDVVFIPVPFTSILGIKTSILLPYFLFIACFNPLK